MLRPIAPESKALHKLSRTVRFAINDTPQPSGVNGFAGNPPLQGFGKWYEVLITCRGNVDQKTGYLIDIKTIDAAVRIHATPLLEKASVAGQSPGSVLPEICRNLATALPATLESFRLKLSPYHSLEMAASDQTTVLVRQKFDFSAAHRLHSPALSDEENRNLYGKCNNPRGHGHNYVVEPAVAVPIANAPRLTLADLEAITDQAIIRHFDHKHLNEDTTEFSVEKGGVLPSVENIAKVCFERLSAAIANHPARPVLSSITVWETDRTSATYPG